MVTCQSMLSMAKKANFFDSILTGDEKWIAFDNTHRGFTVVRPGPSARRDAKTPQIRQKGHVVRLVEYERNRASRGTGKRSDS
jgi:hypothetical protein